MSVSGIFKTKRGDLAKSLRWHLTPTTIDLTGSSVVFNMKDRDGNIIISRAPALIITTTGDPTVQYDWQAGQTDTAGLFLGEFEVIYSNGKPETSPDEGFIPIMISDDIA